MHYYQRHLGDYTTATPHLSLVEHGAYTKLLDYYYSSESPIPDDRCERIAGAFDPHEREAVRSVLQQFFTLTELGWVNERAERELAGYRSKSLKAKESAAARWKRTQCDGNAIASPNAMLTNNQEPITKKEQKQKPARAALVFVEAPEWLDPTAWAEWCQYRKSKRWGDSAQRYSLDELHKLRLDGHDPPAVIRQSIAAGWTGLFPLKTNGATHGTNRLSAADQVRAHVQARELADRTNGHTDPVAADGGDLRPPLDGEFRRGP